MTRSGAWQAALLLAAAPVAAFELGERLPVTAAHGPTIYHHVVSAGRKNIAASGGVVAVTWEDNRSGVPEVYVAFRRAGDEAFGVEHRVSTGGEAFEPTIAALGRGRFLVAWEERDRVWLRLATAEGLGTVQAADDAPGQQATLGAAGEAVQIAWARTGPAGPLVQHARVDPDPATGTVRVLDAVAVDPVEGQAYQAFPTVAVLADGSAVVVWEDRRFGHTRLLHARRGVDGRFGEPATLNAFNAPKAGPSTGAEPVRLGSGAMRPAVAAADRIVGAWLDKRDLGSGYAIWGATSRDGGLSFGANQKIQDDSGGSQAVPHWNVSIAGHPGGRAVVAWDDAREAWSDPDETGDVFISWSTDSGWSGDHPIRVASGAGRQAQPAVALDEAGDLHLVWTEQAAIKGPSRLWYSRGTPPPAR